MAMELGFDVGAFSIGCAGALSHEALRWIGLRTQCKLPVYMNKLHYWLLTLLLIVIGGIVAGLLGPASGAQAMAYGIAAPSILSRIGSLKGDTETLAGPAVEANSHRATRRKGRLTAALGASLGDFLRG